MLLARGLRRSGLPAWLWSLCASVAVVKSEGLSKGKSPCRVWLLMPHLMLPQEQYVPFITIFARTASVDPVLVTACQPHWWSCQRTRCGWLICRDFSFWVPSFVSLRFGAVYGSIKPSFRRYARKRLLNFHCLKQVSGMIVQLLAHQLFALQAFFPEEAGWKSSQFEAHQ